MLGLRQRLRGRAVLQRRCARSSGRAIHAHAQILLRHHALGLQEIVAGLVHLQQNGSQLTLQWIQHRLQVITGHARLYPLLHQMEGHGFGTKNVVLGKLTPLHRLDAQTQ